MVYKLFVPKQTLSNATRDDLFVCADLVIGELLRQKQATLRWLLWVQDRVLRVRSRLQVRPMLRPWSSTLLCLVGREGRLLLLHLLGDQKELLRCLRLQIFEIIDDHLLGERLEKQSKEPRLDSAKDGVDLLQMLEKEVLLVQLHLVFIHEHVSLL